MEKTEQINIRVSESEKKLVREQAKALGQSITTFMMTGKCNCGEKGYEGIFSQVTWKCGSCGKQNHWRGK